MALDSILRFIDLNPDPERRGKDAGKYPYTIPAIASLTRLELHPRVTYFVGENGSGKSTLLEALAITQNINAEGGSQHTRFSTAGSESTLHDALDVMRGTRAPVSKFFLRAESTFVFASELEVLSKEEGGGEAFAPYGGDNLHSMSHGQAFLAILRNRLVLGGLYLMDEPESALSIHRQLEFLALVHQHVRKGSQFVIATHSPVIMGYPDAFIYEFSEQGIGRRDWDEVDNVWLTREFLRSRQSMLRELLENE